MAGRVNECDKNMEEILALCSSLNKDVPDKGYLVCDITKGVARVRTTSSSDEKMFPAPDKLKDHFARVKITAFGSSFPVLHEKKTRIEWMGAKNNQYSVRWG